MATEGGCMSGWTGKNDNLRVSRRLSRLLVLVVVSLALVVGASTFWMAGVQNRMAEEAARAMVRANLAAFRENLEVLATDYALWDDAFDSLLSSDAERLWPNAGVGVPEGADVDLLLIVLKDWRHGWRVGGGDAPSPDVLGSAALEATLGLLEGAPSDLREPRSAFAWLDGELWLLTVSRVMPRAGPPQGLVDADLPRLIMGRRFGGAAIARIESELLIDDVRVGAAPHDGDAASPLKGFTGAPAAYVLWSPPRPGWRAAAAVAPFLLGILAVAAAAILVASRFVLGAARRLEDALVAAQAADRSKTEFLANVSHELRTPMNGVMGMLQILRRTTLDDKQRQFLEVATNSAQSQIALISDLLDIARMEINQRALDNVPFTPRDQVRQVCELLRPAAREKGLALEVEAVGDVGTAALGDAEAFKQICTNLVANAVKFTASGFVRIRLEAQARQDGLRLRLSVSDSGPGVAPADQERIFERFTQADGSTTRMAGGAGLGLAIVRSLAELMEGRVELESAPGAGSTFTVSLTLEEAAASPAAAA